MKLKAFFQKIWAAVEKAWDRLTDETKVIIPVAIRITEGVKELMDGEIDDVLAFLLKKAIKGQTDDVLIDKIKKTIEDYLPKILLELRVMQSVANIADKNEQMKAIIAEISKCSVVTQNLILHDINVVVTQALADGKLTFGECVVIGETVYQKLKESKNNKS